MEVLLRGPSAASSPDSLWLGTLSDSIGESTWRRRQSHTLWPSDGFAICAVSRQGHFIVGDWTSSSPRNGANRKRLAIFPFQPLALALLHDLQQSTRRACSLNLLPQSITLRRATAGVRPRRLASHTTPDAFNPRSRVSALSVVARGRGNTCVM